MEKIFLTLAFTLGALAYSTAQDSLNNKKEAFIYEVSYVGDAVNNLSGGIQKGSCYLGMANIKIHFNTENAKLWKGGELFVNAVNTHGATPSADLIGDFQTISNLEAGNHTYIQEFWFSQKINNGAFIIGLQDLCAEFLSSDNAALFLNSSCGVHSTISSNLPVPIFPLTSVGAQIQYEFYKNITGKIAIFDGLPDDFSTNPYNLNWRLKQDEGFLSFAEITFANLFNNAAGKIKFGSYFHNSYKINSSDELKDSIMSENYGFYLTCDQVLYHNASGRELSFFVQSSFSPMSVNDNWYYVGFGLNYKGLFKKRTDDILGLAVASAGFRNNSNETVIELTYKMKLNDNFFIQPDLQYVINPAGTTKKLDNAMVGILRLGLNF